MSKTTKSNAVAKQNKAKVVAKKTITELEKDKKVAQKVEVVAEKKTVEQAPKSVAETKVVEQAPKVTPVAKSGRKILFVATECQPFVATGGLADVAGSLPKAIKKQNPDFDVRVMIPLYSDISNEFRSKFTYVGNIFTTLGWRKQYCGLFEYKMDGVTYYFVDNEYYFKRKNIYGHFDDAERFAFFSKSVFELLPMIDFVPDIIHANDWQTALVPIYYSLYFGHELKYCNIKVIFSIHNIEYQGKYSHTILEDVFGISRNDFSVVENDGIVNLLKGAIVTAHQISTVSPTYARQILDPVYSHGLDNILRDNQHKLCGILNGIDEDFYNPKTDKALFANYDSQNLEGKAICKKELQNMLDLPQRDDVPIYAVISRLVQHKGLDLIKGVLEEVLKNDIQLVVLGKGDALYENFFLDMQRVYGAKMRSLITYNVDLSRKLYSGADIFIMPSKSEPCGLAQMICSKYGTVPIVRETGGLADSIKDVGSLGGGNGFTFTNYRVEDLLNRIFASERAYHNREEWKNLQKKIMNIDFSWDNSAKKYVDMYEYNIKK